MKNRHIRYVLRGGSWDYDAHYTRCAIRDDDYPDYSNSLIGFRCVIKNKRKSRRENE